MSIRSLLGTALLVALAGCSAEAPVAGEAAQALGVGGGGKMRCPDPATDCTSSNGTGVYYQEFGHAGIGTAQLMITHFMNVGAGTHVYYEGRYFNAATNKWLVAEGSVYYARYQGQDYSVGSVTESATIPTWNLINQSTQAPLTLTAGQIAGLTVAITFADPNDGINKTYELTFGTPSPYTDKATLRTFPLTWLDTKTRESAIYCVDAEGNQDNVIFQQAIAVNPVSAAVTRDSSTTGYVTLSCRLGAIATVRSWGYTYRKGSTYSVGLYDAALQMKRASYCADGTYFTEPGTQIRIEDSEGAQSDDVTSSNLEAYWTPQGAACLTGNYRHPELQPPLPGTKCGNGHLLPLCTPSLIANITAAPLWLADGTDTDITQ